MTHEDINRFIISFLLVFLSALVIILSLKLGARQREVRDLRQQMTQMEVKE